MPDCTARRTRKTVLERCRVTYRSDSVAGSPSGTLKRFEAPPRLANFAGTACEITRHQSWRSRSSHAGICGRGAFRRGCLQLGHLPSSRPYGMRIFQKSAIRPSKSRNPWASPCLRRSASLASSGRHPRPTRCPLPLSTCATPSSTVTAILVAPAWMAFPQSSLTTEVGRSTTSPAAVRSATSGRRTRIRTGWFSIEERAAATTVTSLPRWCAPGPSSQGRKKHAAEWRRRSKSAAFTIDPSPIPSQSSSPRIRQ